jgi:polysaccharide deacetylase family protein (PEP-CTERM system associated)
MTNILSVDVEDYFHPTEFQLSHGASTWETLPSRVEDSTDRILEIFDRHGVKSTCFILGWVARRHPQLIRRIANAGHEIACHSNWHRLVYDLTPGEFRQDTTDAVRIIEDACGQTPRAYRAPSYSITARSLWALEILAECGFTHDSSIYPIAHDRYGIPGFPRRPVRVHTPSGELIEVPIATVRLGTGRVAPIGGGGYLRLFPYRYTSAGIRKLNAEEGQTACMYLHPWEVDPAQPRLINSWIGRMRTYTGLAGMAGKLSRLTKDFQFSTLRDVVSPSSVQESWVPENGPMVK